MQDLEYCMREEVEMVGLKSKAVVMSDGQSQTCKI